MNRKVFRSLFLAFPIFVLVLASCDHRSPEEKWKAEITYFIMLQADDFKSYESILFQKIDLAYLESQKEVQTSVAMLQDTIETRLRHFAMLDKSSAQLTNKLYIKLKHFPVDQVDDFLVETARLDQVLDRYLEKTPADLISARKDTENALEQLNNYLKPYSLSIYNIDLDDGESVLYYHEFRLQGNQHTGVFELDKESLKVVAYKEIS